MPTSKILKDSKEGKGSKKSLEKKWDEAKHSVEHSNGGKDNWPETMSVYKKMTHQASIQLNATTRLKATGISKEQIAASVKVLADAPNLSVGLQQLASMGCVGLEKVILAHKHLADVCANFGRENGMPEDHAFVQGFVLSSTNMDKELKKLAALNN